MSIGDETLLKGYPFLDLFGERPVTIEHLSDVHDSMFRVSRDGSNAAILFKTSTATRRRWPFALTGQELEALQNSTVTSPLENRYLALVCRQDGICLIPLEVLLTLVSRDAQQTQTLSISRPKGGSYRASGPGKTQLERTIPASDWPVRLWNR